MGELPPEVRSLTTTLAEEAGSKINRTLLLQQLLRDLESWYHKFLKNDADILEAWKQLNLTVGNRVSVSGAGEFLEGLAQGIDNEGRLIVRLDDATMRTVAAGDVTIVKT